MNLRKYGLIGKSLSHSFSKEYFNNKFLSEGISNCEYDNYELQDHTEIETFLNQTNGIGFNVTIPYKEQVISFLDDLDIATKEINSVNTIKIYPDGKSKGFNTDYLGFTDSLQSWDLQNIQEALVFGSGGSSKAIQYSLKQLDIPFLVVSRTKIKNGILYKELDKEIIKERQLLINCTPLGTYPNTDEMIPIPYELIDSRHFVFDLVYNPSRSKLLKLASIQGAKIKNGLDMLRKQAEESWKIWQDDTI